jgi:hypothetical protein
MKRFLLFAAAVAALSFPALVSAAKPTDAVHGPTCGDITLHVDYTFDTQGATSGPATATSFLTTAAPSCAKATYYVYYYDTSGSLLRSCPYTGDGTSTEFGPSCVWPSETGDPLCVFGTSVGDDGHVIDSAPDLGCNAFGEPISPSPFSGASGFN